MQLCTSLFAVTRVALPAPDPDTAQWSADSPGRSEIEEVAERFAYGANSPIISYAVVFLLVSSSAGRRFAAGRPNPLPSLASSLHPP